MDNNELSQREMELFDKDERVEYCDECGCYLLGKSIGFLYDDTLYEVCSNECRGDLLSQMD